MVGSGDKVKNMFKKKFPSLSSLGSDGNTSFLRAARAGHLDKVLEQLRNNVDINTSNANGLNALHLASKDGHVHVVTELLKRGANVDSATKKGNTALHIASLAGQEEVVRLLVEHGACVNVQSQNGFTPLYMAAQENHDNVVKYLLSNGANQSLATEDGFTPLAVAMQQGHDKVVAVLLENDTRGKVRLPALHIAAKKDDCKAAALLLQNEHNPDVTSKSGFTPLHIASHYGNEGIANLLLGKGADVNYSAKHNITPLHVAAKWGKSNMVSLLLEKGANIESKTRDGLTPLHCAARSGHEQVVDMLLERGAPISCKTKNGLAPLHMASQGDHVDAARILLYHRAPVDEVTVDYLTALHVAAHCGHARVAKLLLDRKADPNARALNGFTPLHIACKKNRIKVVELLLKHGASIEATTESGLTPLHVASFMGCMNIVIYLLQNEANPDVPTVRGETPLHLAARANQTDIIRILLRNGAQVDARAREQQTPLHIASRLGNVDIVMLLLQHGAAVDCTTKDLYSALHIAAKEGQDEVASVLLENGASPTATTKKGFTPLHLAAKYGNIKVARLLLQKDSPVDTQGKNGVTPLHVASHYDHQNVALLLLDKGASPHATAKNGHTPLHIAAKKNQMDIATTLLEFGAKANAESKAGFTPLHLSAQEGHLDMSSLLIDHQADTNHKAKNGLAPLHLCAQEDRVNVASTLVKNGAEVDSTTKAGYTPLHVACHFGQINMVRFLLEEGSKVTSSTAVGYTPLHQAAQQGHCGIVNALLQHGAPPNATTNQGQTAMSIAQKLGYISVVETLKGVTEPTTITPSGDEKYKVVSPETMQETFMSDSEDEGGEDTLLSEQPYRYLTVDEMKSLGDDSLPIDVRQDERMDSNRECMSVPPTAVDESISPAHMKESYSQFTTPDNVLINKHPLHVGFLVSFLVDARGGAMRGCRHSGVRVIVPPRRASMPMRVTCRYLKRDKLSHPPPLMEGEALASRILELGPVSAKFLGPVMIEVPHFGSLRGKEREIVILRSDNGETWREHTVDCSEEAVQDVLSHSFDKEVDMSQLDESGRTTRILTTDFPHYFAVVTRVRQEVHAIGPEGGMVSSSVVPQVQAVFPQGALTKKIKVGLQAQPIPAELAAKLLGNRVAVSPIVTVEPRRRKFHKPITLTIPKPQAANKGMINNYSGDAPTLRLLCSITGGTTRAQWEDVTGSTPFTFVNDCVSFTTTVSARFWLMDCRNVGDATKMATELYREAIHVPFMAKFVVFAKRVDPLEARLRIFCMTDDKEDKTLEHQEHFTEVAKSRDVEVLEGKTQYVEFAGNLVPVTKSGEQLQLSFRAFRENRLPFTVRVKDPHADCVGRTLFMREARLPKGEPPQQPICVLNIVLPEEIIPEASLPEHELHKYSFIQDSSGLESYQRVDLRLSDISNLLGDDWVRLAEVLEVAPSDINRFKTDHPQSVAQQGLAMLRLWLSQGNKAQASTLESALSQIGRDDIVQQCVFNTDQSSRLLKDDSRDASLRRSIPYSDKDLMKDSESVEDLSRTSYRKSGQFHEKDDKEERKYEAEEKDVDEAKKSVSERRLEIEKRLSMDKQLEKQAEALEAKFKIDKEDFSEKEIAEEKRVSSPEEEPSELSFQQKRLSFEQGKRVIEMKPDKTTMKEVKERALDERFLAEERKAAEKQKREEEKLVDDTSIPFEEKRRSFEQKEEEVTKESTKKEEQRRDSTLFEGVSQGLVRLDAAFTATPQVQDLLSPKTSKTPPPSPAEFKDLTGTVAWTDESPPAVVSAKIDQSQDWAEKGKPDSSLDPSKKGALRQTTKSEDHEVDAKLSVTSKPSGKINEILEIDTKNDTTTDKELKYKFTMAIPDKQTYNETLSSITSFLESEKSFNNQSVKPMHERVAVLADTEVTSSDETEESQSRSESEPKSDKSFVGKVSKRLFGVFKKDEKEKSDSKKGKKVKHKKEKPHKQNSTDEESKSAADDTKLETIEIKKKKLDTNEINSDSGENQSVHTISQSLKIKNESILPSKHENDPNVLKEKDILNIEKTLKKGQDSEKIEDSHQNLTKKSKTANESSLPQIPSTKDQNKMIGEKNEKTKINEQKKDNKYDQEERKLVDEKSISFQTTNIGNLNVENQDLKKENEEKSNEICSSNIDTGIPDNDRSITIKETKSSISSKSEERVVTSSNEHVMKSLKEAVKESIEKSVDVSKQIVLTIKQKDQIDLDKNETSVKLLDGQSTKQSSNILPTTMSLQKETENQMKAIGENTMMTMSEEATEKELPKTQDVIKDSKEEEKKKNSKSPMKNKKEKGKSFFGGFFSRSGEESDDAKSKNEELDDKAKEKKPLPLLLVETKKTTETKIPQTENRTSSLQEKVVTFPPFEDGDEKSKNLDESLESVVQTASQNTDIVPEISINKVEEPTNDDNRKSKEEPKAKRVKDKKSKSFFSGIFSKSVEQNDVQSNTVVDVTVSKLVDETSVNILSATDNKIPSTTDDGKESSVSGFKITSEPHTEDNLDTSVPVLSDPEKQMQELKLKDNLESSNTEVVQLLKSKHGDTIENAASEKLDSSLETSSKLIGTTLKPEEETDHKEEKESSFMPSKSETEVRDVSSSAFEVVLTGAESVLDEGKTIFDDSLKSTKQKSKGAKEKGKSFFSGLFKKSEDNSEQGPNKVSEIIANESKSTEVKVEFPIKKEEFGNTHLLIEETQIRLAETEESMHEAIGSDKIKPITLEAVKTQEVFEQKDGMLKSVLDRTKSLEYNEGGPEKVEASEIFKDSQISKVEIPNGSHDSLKTYVAGNNTEKVSNTWVKIDENITVSTNVPSENNDMMSSGTNKEGILKTIHDVGITTISSSQSIKEVENKSDDVSENNSSKSCITVKEEKTKLKDSDSLKSGKKKNTKEKSFLSGIFGKSDKVVQDGKSKASVETVLEKDKGSINKLSDESVTSMTQVSTVDTPKTLNTILPATESVDVAVKSIEETLSKVTAAGDTVTTALEFGVNKSETAVKGVSTTTKDRISECVSSVNIFNLKDTEKIADQASHSIETIPNLQDVIVEELTTLIPKSNIKESQEIKTITDEPDMIAIPESNSTTTVSSEYKNRGPGIIGKVDTKIEIKSSFEKTIPINNQEQATQPEEMFVLNDGAEQLIGLHETSTTEAVLESVKETETTHSQKKPEEEIKSEKVPVGVGITKEQLMVTTKSSKKGKGKKSHDKSLLSTIFSKVEDKVSKSEKKPSEHDESKNLPIIDMKSGINPVKETATVQKNIDDRGISYDDKLLLQTDSLNNRIKETAITLKQDVEGLLNDGQSKLDEMKDGFFKETVSTAEDRTKEMLMSTQTKIKTVDNQNNKPETQLPGKDVDSLSKKNLSDRQENYSKSSEKEELNRSIVAAKSGTDQVSTLQVEGQMINITVGQIGDKAIDIVTDETKTGILDENKAKPIEASGLMPELVGTKESKNLTKELKDATEELKNQSSNITNNSLVKALDFLDESKNGFDLKTKALVNEGDEKISDAGKIVSNIFKNTFDIAQHNIVQDTEPRNVESTAEVKYEGETLISFEKSFDPQSKASLISEINEKKRTTVISNDDKSQPLQHKDPSSDTQLGVSEETTYAIKKTVTAEVNVQKIGKEIISDVNKSLNKKIEKFKEEKQPLSDEHPTSEIKKGAKVGLSMLGSASEIGEGLEKTLLKEIKDNSELEKIENYSSFISQQSEEFLGESSIVDLASSKVPEMKEQKILTTPIKSKIPKITEIDERTPEILQTEKPSHSRTTPNLSESNDDKLNNILIDMLIEQESIKSLVPEAPSKSKTSLDKESISLPEKHDTEHSEKSTKQPSTSGYKTVTSYGEIESLLTEADIKTSLENDHETGHSSFVTTPTMQRRKIGGSQRLSREERPTLREVTHIIDYSSSDEDETNQYTVTEPTDRKVTFLVESEDENVLKVSDSSSEPEIEVTEMTPSPIPSHRKHGKASAENKSTSDSQNKKNQSDRSAKKVERRFERMASETLEADSEAKYKTDHEFQRMVSQLSSEEVDACLTQWDEGGLTPSEELDSTKDTVEGDIEPDVEALPEAFIGSTNPFSSTSSQWAAFEKEMTNVPSSIFWAFDTTPSSTLIRPNELDIPVKPVGGGGQGNPFTVPSQTNPSSFEAPLYINTLGQSYGSTSRRPCPLKDSPLGAPLRGESAGGKSSPSPVPATTKEGEEALMDLAAGLQDVKGDSFSGPSSAK